MNQIEYAAYKLVLGNVKDLRDFHPPRGQGIVISPKASDIQRDHALKDNFRKVPLEHTPGWQVLAERGIFDEQNSINSQFMRRLLLPLYMEGCKGDVTLVAGKNEAPDGFMRSTLVPAGIMGRQDITVNGRTPNDFLKTQGWIESVRDPRATRPGQLDPQALKDDERRTNIIYPLPLAMVLLEDIMDGDMSLLKAKEGRAHLVSGNLSRRDEALLVQKNPQHETLQQTPGWDRMRSKGVFRDADGHRAIDTHVAKAVTCAACYQFAKQASDLVISARAKDEPEQGLMRLVIVPMLQNERPHMKVNSMSVPEYLVREGWIEPPSAAMKKLGVKHKPAAKAVAPQQKGHKPR